MGKKHLNKDFTYAVGGGGHHFVSFLKNLLFFIKAFLRQESNFVRAMHETNRRARGHKPTIVEALTSYHLKSSIATNTGTSKKCCQDATLLPHNRFDFLLKRQVGSRGLSVVSHVLVRGLGLWR